jgi:hypothetical protein
VAYTLRCMRCKEYFPKQEMKEGKDGYWRCDRKCGAREGKQGATEQGGSQEDGNG